MEIIELLWPVVDHSFMFGVGIGIAIAYTVSITACLMLFGIAEEMDVDN